MTNDTTTPGAGEGLKPCPNPWCISTGAPVPVGLTNGYGNRSGWVVACACGVRTHRANTRHAAISGWQTRRPPPDRPDLADLDRTTLLARPVAGEGETKPGDAIEAAKAWMLGQAHTLRDRARALRHQATVAEEISARDPAWKYMAEQPGRHRADASHRELVADGLEAILTAAPSPSPEAWKPIDENTPRDGSTILAAHGSAVITVSWDEYAAGWVNGAHDRYEDLITYPVTHWMPLPALPTKGGV